MSQQFAEPLPVHVHGKLKGYYVPGERTYYRVADRRNFCRKYDGWGIQASVVEMLRAEGCETVVIDLEGQHRTVQAPLSFFFTAGYRDTLNEYDGAHIFLAARHFRDRDPKLPRRAVLWR